MSTKNQGNNTDPWGYKGSKTALNGLTEWMYKNTDINSHRKMCNLVIQYGLENDMYSWPVNYDDKRSVHDTAHAIARQIQDKQLFQQFTIWVLQTIK